MTQSAAWKRWVEAAKVLAEDPTAAVPCPECGEADLAIRDAKLGDEGKISRILHCPTCKAHNEMRMTWKPN